MALCRIYALCPDDADDGSQDLEATKCSRSLWIGSFGNALSYAQCAYRYWDGAELRNGSISFRVVVPPL